MDFIERNAMALFGAFVFLYVFFGCLLTDPAVMRWLRKKKWKL